MKYNLKVTLLLVLLFVAAQLVGLILVNGSIQQVVTTPGGEVVIEHSDTPIERPPTEGVGSFVYILIGIAFATLLLLLIIRLRLYAVWKVWFFLAVWLTVTVALSVYIQATIAAGIALLLAITKIFRRDPIIYNLTEILIYSGIVVLFVPVFDVVWVAALLIAISAYDIIAVRHTKHMVSMAKFLMKSDLFAGLSIPLGKRPKGELKTTKAVKTKTVASVETEVQHSAILGGGDIAFPLLFSGVVMESLIIAGLAKTNAFALTLIVTLCATAALVYLFKIAERNKFYPAMPFLTAGCLVGYALIQLILLI